MLYLGTRGWDYDHWTNGFYTTSDSEEWFKQFSKIAAFCELRSTFDDIPSEEMVDALHNDSPKHFIFSVLMAKNITRDLYQKPKKEDLEKFFNSLFPLKNKLGVVILQFAAKLQFDSTTFDQIKDLIMTCREYFPGFFVLDLKNRSWHKPEVIEFFKNNDAAFLSSDKRPIPSLMANPEIYYLRLQGDTRLIERKDFGKVRFPRENDLKQWSKYLAVKTRRHKKVFVSIDNHFSGNAIKDAYGLAEFLKAEKTHKFIGFQKD